MKQFIAGLDTSPLTLDQLFAFQDRTITTGRIFAQGTSLWYVCAENMAEATDLVNSQLQGCAVRIAHILESKV